MTMTIIITTTTTTTTTTIIINHIMFFSLIAGRPVCEQVSPMSCSSMPRARRSAASAPASIISK